MKKLNVIKVVFGASLLSTIFMIDGCKKETAVTPATPSTVSTRSVTDVDSTNFLKGYLGNDPVKFEGNVISYNGYIDPDSAQNQGGSPRNHGGNQNNGNGQQQYDDHDAYFMSGSKWVTLSSAGLQSTNASIELRSLAVRVFVSPVQAASSNYYNLIELATYRVATDDNPSKGAYVSLYDNNGVLWTTAGDQDGSTLTLTSVGANMNTYTVVTGTISAKMYDGHGNMKKLTGATFTASLGI